ncbi:hypothetical protein [Sutcliffiella cohnii]|uniref:hypothetical protein n=1 Tax=Sutcliffiella cohnii TaxID=33932 RepID=UPI002E1C960B|nr:hypothetical protein [Sutcliffiella cohnii]
MGVINREVGEQGKGFRLQRLRAVKLMLNNMKKSENAIIYAATEYIDDVYIKSIEGDQVDETAEGDKDYHSKKAFSFMSEEVKNSMVSFIDSWFEYSSKNITYCFYTNVDIAKEKNTKGLKALDVTLPDKPIVTLLMNKEFDYPNLLDTVKKVVIHEYKKQYSDPEEGHLYSIEKMSDDLWKEFLNQLDWKFGEEDDKELEATLIQEIGQQSFYPSVDITGKESHVLSILLAELEKRQNNKDLLGRLINHSDVRRVILEVGSNQYRKNDPLYEQWEKLPPPDDKRNLEEKVLDVCEKYNTRKLGMFARKVGMVKRELASIDSKDRGAYQFRIYDACEEKLFELIEEHEGEVINQNVIDEWIKELVACAEGHLEDMSQDYTYPFKNSDTLRNTILELIDSCYLAFDR